MLFEVFPITNQIVLMYHLPTALFTHVILCTTISSFWVISKLLLTIRLLNTYDGEFLQKWLIVRSSYLFSQKSFIIIWRLIIYCNLKHLSRGVLLSYYSKKIHKMYIKTPAIILEKDSDACVFLWDFADHYFNTTL